SSKAKRVRNTDETYKNRKSCQHDEWGFHSPIIFVRMYRPVMFMLFIVIMVIMTVFIVNVVVFVRVFFSFYGIVFFIICFAISVNIVPAMSDLETFLSHKGHPHKTRHVNGGQKCGERGNRPKNLIQPDIAKPWNARHYAGVRAPGLPQNLVFRKE